MNSRNNTQGNQADQRTFLDIAAELGGMLDRKRLAYGDNMTIAPKILELLYPNGVPVSAYPTMLLLVRILDKIARLATGGGRFALGEDAWKDIAGYALCALYDFGERDSR